MRVARREIALVALHLGADAGDGHGRDAVAVAGVDELHQVLDRLVLVLGADVDLGGDGGGVEADAVLDVDRDQLARELGEDALAAGAAQDEGVGRRRRDHRAQRAARAHQHVRMRNQRHDAEVHALEAGGRPLEVAVVEGEHHGLARGRIEDPRQPVLHAPVERAAALDVERLVLLRHAEAEVLAFSDVVFVSHNSRTYHVRHRLFRPSRLRRAARSRTAPLIRIS